MLRSRAAPAEVALLCRPTGDDRHLLAMIRSDNPWALAKSIFGWGTLGLVLLSSFTVALNALVIPGFLAWLVCRSKERHRDAEHERIERGITSCLQAFMIPDGGDRGPYRA